MLLYLFCCRQLTRSLWHIQVKLYILRSNLGKICKVSAFVIVLFNSMLIFVDWTMPRCRALSWDNAAMGVISRK